MAKVKKQNSKKYENLTQLSLSFFEEKSTNTIQELTSDFDFPIKMEFSSKKISTELKNVLISSEVLTQPDGTYELVIPQISASLYKDFKLILRALRGYWNRKTHVFHYDPSALISEIVKISKYPELNPLSFFPTPLKTAKDMALVVDFYHSSDNYSKTKILEPSAGDGSICRALMEYESNLSIADIDCIEIDPLNQKILKNQGFNVIASDFLSHDFQGEKYRWIFMNPPFSSKGHPMLWMEHIKLAYEILEPGGKISAIVPDSFIHSDNKIITDFRNFVALRGGWESCDDKAFAESGTSVSCHHIYFEKPYSQRELQNLIDWNVKQLVDISLPSESDYFEHQSKMVEKLLSGKIKIPDAKAKTLEFLNDKIKKFSRLGTAFCWDEYTQQKAIESFEIDLKERFDYIEAQNYIFTLAELEDMPIIQTGHFDNLKFVDSENKVEVWLSRCGKKHGNHCDNIVTVNKFDPNTGNWEVIGSYQAL